MIMFHVSLPGCILDQIALLVDDFGIFFDLEETFGPILSIFRVKGTGEEADREALVGGWWFWLPRIAFPENKTFLCFIVDIQFLNFRGALFLFLIHA